MVSANLSKLILPDGTKMSEFALSGSVGSTSGVALLSGAVFTGLVKVSYDNASLSINHDNASTEGSTINFQRQNSRKAFIDLDTSDNLQITLQSGKKFTVVWG